MANSESNQKIASSHSRRKNNQGRQLTKLSVNVNKVALLRNSRGGNVPDLLKVAADLIQFGADGITVHPRPDGRHVRHDDVHDLATLVKKARRKNSSLEFNVEGYPSENFLRLLEKARPDQATLVPDKPNALTSNAGWKLKANKRALTRVVRRLQKAHIRVSLFIDVFKMSRSEWLALADINPDRVELYTERYARDFAVASSKMRARTTSIYANAARQAQLLGIAVNAGHDLNLKNLRALLRAAPEIAEVSIGHALICQEALYMGLQTTIRRYRQEIKKAGPRHAARDLRLARNQTGAGVHQSTKTRRKQ